MNEKVVTKTKMQLDENFNIIDPKAEERKSWLLEDVWDLEQQILETKETLKGYGK